MKSYAGKNHFGKYRPSAMKDLIHFLRYIPCVEIVNLRSLCKKNGSHFSGSPYGGVRRPPT